MSGDSVVNTTDALTRSVVESFAEMAFVDVVPSEPADVTVSHIIRIRYDGAETGELLLYLPQACKRRIAENVYGVEWSELHHNEIDDCLLELLNVIAGNFLRVHFGTEGEHDLSLPELHFDESRMGHRGHEDWYFSAEGDLFKVSFEETK